MLSKTRQKVGATVLGLTMAVGAAAPAIAVDPVYPPAPQAVACHLKPIKNQSHLKLNVNPNLPGSKNYLFKLQKRKQIDGNRIWVTKGYYKTQGKAETRVMNRGKGKYRVLCYGEKYGYLNAYSANVRLKK